MRVRVGVRSIISIFSCLVTFCISILVCRNTFMQKMFLVIRLKTNCRISLIPLNAIWGLCWYNFCRIFYFCLV